MSGCLTPAFSEAHKTAKMLRKPCILGVPRQKDKIRAGCFTSDFWGTKSEIAYQKKRKFHDKKKRNSLFVLKNHHSLCFSKQRVA